MSSSRTSVTRRSLLAAAAGAVGLVACTRAEPTPAPSSATSSALATSGTPLPTSGVPAVSSPASPSPTTSAGRAALPRTAPWEPDAADVQPDVKRLAARVVEALGAWPVGAAGVSAAKSRLGELGVDPALGDEASSILGQGDTAAVQVVLAQYGGILADSASVLVVARRWVAEGSALTDGGYTVDVRLQRSAAGWRVVHIYPGDPGPALPDLSATARRVLGNARIDLPPEALADVHAGTVHDSVLGALDSVSARFSIGVSVLRTGHPLDVFGTSRRSDHPVGRAVDTWTIDGHPVVSAATPRSLVVDYMMAMGDAGSYNVGGPVAVRRTGYFTDDTHHDHVHAGFTA